MSDVVITKLSSWVILPDTAFRFIWDCVALFSTFLYAFIIPYQISFASDRIYFTKVFFNLILDLFFVIDVYARINHFAILKDGLLLFNRDDFRKAYLTDEFFVDLLSSCPISSFALAAGVTNSATYGILRIIQLLRLLRFVKYFNRFVEALNVYGSIAVSTAAMRITQIFMLVIVISHWFACMYHWIGDNESHGWIYQDQITEENDGKRYLRSLYWAIYTVTTVGYGSVPVKTNWERIFAMFAMVVGAVICDAGITAVLSSIIHNKDYQAGTNSRRLQCSKQYLKSQAVPQEIQERVLDYYSYADVEIEGVREEDVFQNISRALKNSILNHFCYGPIRRFFPSTFLCNGEVAYLVNSMSPYTAIPGEKLSEIGKKCEVLFVLQRGNAYTTNVNEQCWKLPPGAVIGNLAADLSLENEFQITKGISGCFMSTRGFKGKFGYLYIVIECGKGQYCSSLLQSKKINKQYDVQFESSCKSAVFSVRGWRKQKQNLILGTAKIDLCDCNGNTEYFYFEDGQGRKVGSVEMNCKYYSIREDDKMTKNCEKMTEAESYCHLYKVDKQIIDEIKEYAQKSNLQNLHDRLLPRSTTQVIHKLNSHGDTSNSNGEIDEGGKLAEGHKSHDTISCKNDGNGGIGYRNQKEGVIGKEVTQDSKDTFDENQDWDNVVNMSELKCPSEVERRRSRRRSTFFVEWERVTSPGKVTPLNVV